MRRNQGGYAVVKCNNATEQCIRLLMVVILSHGIMLGMFTTDGSSRIAGQG